MKSLCPALLAFAALFSLPMQGFSQQGQRSQQMGDKNVVVEVQNGTQYDLGLFWVDFEGKKQDYGQVPAGQTVPVQTYPGHLWSFQVGQQAVGVYRANTADKQIFTVSGAGQNTTPTNQPTMPTPQGQPRQPVQVNQPNVNDIEGWLKKEMQKRLNRNNSGLPPRTNNQPTVPTGNPVVVMPPTPAQPTTPPQSQPVPGNTGGAISNTGSKMTAQEAQQMVAFHNQVRAEVGVGQVTWSPEIAQFAQQWADHLAQQGKFEHRPNNQQKYGENLAAGSSPNYRPIEGAQGWYGEKNLYPPRAPFSVQLLPAGHYTQMVWRQTTQIGAGKAVCTRGQYKGWTIVVCNYNPRGNMQGQPAY